MEDRLKDDIDTVLIRKYDFDYKAFMKLGRKRRYKGKLYSSEERWQCRRKEEWKAY
jgi:hypothetical protein